MDLDAYYREQDKRMNLPDEDIDDYLKRIGARRIPSRDAAKYGQYEYSIRYDTSRDLTAAMPSTAPQEAPNVISHVHEAPARKRKQPTEDTPSELLQADRLGAKVRTSIATKNESRDFDNPAPINSAWVHKSPQGQKRKLSATDAQEPVLSGNRPTSSKKIRKSLDLASPSRLSPLSPSVDVSGVNSSSSYEDISRFTEDATPDRSLSPILSMQASGGGLKRLASRNVDSLNQQRKRSVSPSIEDITTLDANSVKAAFNKPSEGGKGKARRQAPALNLKPIIPLASASSDNALTSPTEDFTSAQANNGPQFASINLYLEVKQRVAQHAAAKRRDRVVKLASEQSTIQDTVSDPDVSSSKRRRISPAPKLEPAEKTSAIVSKLVSSKSSNVKAKSKSTKGKSKQVSIRLTPQEYAEKLCNEVKEKMATASEQDLLKQSKPSKLLSGMNIFYTGGDMNVATERTRGRMELIVKYGGTLVPRYDPSVVTHVITDAQIRPTLRALGIKRLVDIPNHIPTVTWGWVASSIGRTPTLTREGLKVRMDELFMHAAFHERFDAGPDNRAVPKASGTGKGKAKALDPEDADFSHISGFPQSMEGCSERAKTTNKGFTLNIPPTNIGEVTENDPLAQFYARARADRDTKWSRHGEAEESNTDISDFDVEEPLPVVASKAPKKKGWTCDGKVIPEQPCPNQDIIDKLEELKALHQAKLGDDDRWRVFSYTKCIRALRHHPKRISTMEEAQNLRGVGHKTAEKIMEILQTGDLRRIGYENTEGVQVTKVFQGVYGVGQPTAYQWYAAGCRSLGDVLAGKGGVTLTPAQKIGIQFYDDINDRMPREEAREIFELVKTVALKIDSQLFIEIMGSYRRGKADCGDIDILITRPPDDGITHKGVLSRLLGDLHNAGILTEDLACPEDPDDLEAIYRGLCRIPGRKGAKRRRIDFLTVPWSSRGAALLYYTGDDIFNRAIRMKASVLGYSLNQRGLFGGVVRDPRDRRKLNTGTIIASEREEDIFKILDVPWQEPHERVRG